MKGSLRLGQPTLTATALALVVASGYTATAQAAESASAEATQLETVVVTARRREEAIQDVPLAVSVLDAKALEDTGTFNVGKLTQLQPSIQFVSSNPRNSATTIRGLGAPFGLTNDGIEQGVGIYIDQVYYARSSTATFDFLDVDQVEVLRGPQGTLYGKNTTAGAINVTSRRPSFTTEGRAELTKGNLGLVQAKGAISGPLSDTVAARVATSYTSRDGTIYNVRSGKLINEQDNLGFKGQVLWRPSAALDVTFTADYTHSDPECCGTVYVRTGSTQRAVNRQYDYLAANSGSGYQVPSTNPFDRVTDLDTELNAEQVFAGGSVLAEWRVGPGTLTSVSAYRKWDWYPSNDRDFIGLPITTISANPSKQRQWSQELRYAAAGDQFDYVAGLFGFYQTVNTKGVQEQGALASRWLLSGTNANDPTILNGLRSQNDIGLKNTSAAAFGQVSWHVTDKLDLQPGLRLNYDKKDGKYIATVTNATNTTLTSAQLGVLAPQSYSPKFSDTNVSGDFTASYKLAADVLGYATYARSFKTGGINMSGLPLNAANTAILDNSLETVKPETINHYEAGLKTQFLDRKATLNLSGYWTDIYDYQATVNNGQVTVIRGYLANADHVRVRGVEADFSYRPVERFNVYLNGAYTDHQYVKFTNAPCPPELSGGNVATTANPASPAGTPGFSPLTCDISGQWLPGISKLSASYGFEYRQPTQLLSNDANLYFAFDGSYRSKFSSNPSRSVYMDVDGYALSNFRAGVRNSKGWDIYGWVRNAFNTEYFDYLTAQSGSTGLIVGQPGDPRTYGVTVRASF